MKKTLTFSQKMSLGLLLFAILFGAGNVIFPPILGQCAGKNLWIALTGFIIADVGLSLLGVIAITFVGGDFNKLANRVNSKFSFIFTIAIYLALGPLCAIPRTGAVSFEANFSYLLGTNLGNQWIFRLLFTLGFFLITYFLSLNPSKLVDFIGKIITPILLIFLTIVVVRAIVFPIGSFQNPIGKCIDAPFFQGFLSGYLTLDVLCALLISPLVISSIKNFGIKDSKSIVKNTIISGVIASLGLLFVYFSLGYVGASSVSLGRFSDGAKLLSAIMNALFGKSGALMLGIVITLACLTTSIGITSSFSEYFSKVFPKISYKKFAALVSFFSFLIANMGLSTLLKFTEPLLGVLYPITIILILVSFFDKFIHSKSSAYTGAVIGTFFISILNVLDNLNLFPNSISLILHKIPFYDLGIGWLIPAIICCVVGYFIPYNSANQ